MVVSDFNSNGVSKTVFKAGATESTHFSQSESPLFPATLYKLK